MLNKEILERFKCSGCGTCCRWGGFVLLEDADVAAIAAHLGMSEDEFIASRTRLASNRRQLALLDQADGSCEFLEVNRCRIYDVRPEQCRTFPHAWDVPAGCPELDKLRGEQKNIEQHDGNP